MLEGAIIPQDR